MNEKMHVTTTSIFGVFGSIIIINYSPTSEACRGLCYSTLSCVSTLLRARIRRYILSIVLNLLIITLLNQSSPRLANGPHNSALAPLYNLPCLKPYVIFLLRKKITKRSNKENCSLSIISMQSMQSVATLYSLFSSFPCLMSSNTAQYQSISE